MKGFIALLAATLLVIGAGIAVIAGPAPDASSVGSELKPIGPVAYITQADSGHTTRIRRGQIVKVLLSDSGLVWSALRELGQPLLRERGSVTKGPKELSESFLAVAAGRTTLQATAGPKCLPAQACPQFLLLWRVQVIVTS